MIRAVMTFRVTIWNLKEISTIITIICRTPAICLSDCAYLVRFNAHILVILL